MTHRGPDDEGEWWASDGRVGFGHRRLAIIDLSAGAHQPMQNDAAGLCLVFNGEIYNFKDLRAELQARGRSFATRSDTEVVLQAYREWGTDCLQRLNGMFAFAIYDARQQQLLLARDRAGEKPLFYSLEKQSIRFASELKALMADPTFERRIDPHALDCYLAAGFVPGERCILEGVNKLPPAHALTFDLRSGRSRLWRYWQLPESSAMDVNVAEEQPLLDELEALLEDAVRRQMVADVPVGILLSGGVDSSLVTALAVRSAGNVKTYTVRFPGYARYDETEHARLIARHFATEHAELQAEPGTVDLLPVLARHFDEPVVDSSMIPTYLVSRLIREQCKVALGGDGGDELFGGYSHYDKLLWLQARSTLIPLIARRALTVGAESVMPLGVRGRNWIRAAATDFNEDVPLIASYYDAKNRQRLLRRDAQSTGTAERVHAARIPPGGDLLQRATRMDFENYLAEDILVKIDRASMANSLEVRCPMLDHRLIEFAFSRIPSDMKATARNRKVLLKKLAARLLPRSFDHQRKQGFSLPLASWLRSGPWLDFFREVLLDRSQDVFDHAFIQSLFRGHAMGRSNDERLFALVMFHLWRREFRVVM